MAKIQNHTCFIQSPAAICINEKRDFLLEWEQCSDIYAIYFDPVFININMTIPALRSELTRICRKPSAFFHLSPFLLKIPISCTSSSVRKPLTLCSNISFYFQHELEEQPDWYWSCRARSYFMDIIGVLERIYHNYYISPAVDHCSSQAIPSELQDILLHITNHLESDLKLDDICQKFLVNRNHVERMFRQYLDDTFYGYIKARRLDRIRYYLRFTELRAKEICHRVGFSSSQNLCKFFKAMTGTSPNQYRDSEVAKRKAFLNASRQEEKESAV